MSKLGRPTNDPGERFSLFIPKSLSKYVAPRGLETKSKRIVQLIKMGIKCEKGVKQ